MSRTKKDRPYWVKSNDKKEVRRASHNHESLGKIVRNFRGKIVKYDEECSLEVPQQHPSSDDHRSTCYYNLGYGYRYWYSRGQDRDDRLNTYYNPLRTLERETLTKATKEYNATGDIEEDIFFPDTHQSCMLGGGYWD